MAPFFKINGIGAFTISVSSTCVNQVMLCKHRDMLQLALPYLCKLSIRTRKKKKKKKKPVLQADGPAKYGQVCFFLFDFFFISGSKNGPKNMKISGKNLIFFAKNKF